jgi:hypothetical protein
MAQAVEYRVENLGGKSARQAFVMKCSMSQLSMVDIGYRYMSVIDITDNCNISGIPICDAASCV